MRCKFWLVFISMLALASSAHAATQPQHVRASLLADVAQIVPGKPFHLGIKLDIDPGWHVYWLNPGDSGSATKIKLDLPKGFTAGEVQFPTPIWMVDPGKINVYGYTDSVMFIATVTPDKSLAAGDADLSAKVSYLVCNDLCIPGHATVDLKLPIIVAGADAGEANKQLFADWIAQLPVGPDKSDVVSNFRQTIHPAQQSVQLDFTSMAAMVPNHMPVPEVFPGPNDDVDVKVEFGEIGGVSGRPWIVPITLYIRPLAGHAMPSVMLPVVIGFDTADHHRRGIITEIDLSKLKPADSKPPHGSAKSDQP